MFIFIKQDTLINYSEVCLLELRSGINGGGRNFSMFDCNFCFLAEVRRDIN